MNRIDTTIRQAEGSELAEARQLASGGSERSRCQAAGSQRDVALLAALLTSLSVAFMWAYGPTWRVLFRVWMSQPDYSHGLFVVPLAGLFLWLRRDRFPQGARPTVCWWGVVLLSAAMLLRWTGLRFAFDPVDGYSLVVWMAGAVLLLCGWRLFRWALPSLLFLLFMVPLPFQLERLLSVPLQRVATSVSCFVLQSLGQPAFAEGTTIILGAQRMQVEQACSGLRIFMGTVALAAAYIIATRRELWEKALLLAGIVPIALTANSARIVATSLLYRYGATEEAARRFHHDMAGWLMIALAAALFGLLLTYLSRLVEPIRAVPIRDIVARRRTEI